MVFPDSILQAVPEIATDRLILRPFEPEDLRALHRVLNEPGILAYFPNPAPPSPEKVERFIEDQWAHWRQHGYGCWAVSQPADKDRRLIGWNGLQYLPETDETEVGFLLSSAFWGKGLATEGALASLHFGFANLNVQEIVGIVHPDNLASQRVLEKIGMEARVRTEYFGMEAYRYAIGRSIALRHA